MFCPTCGGHGRSTDRQCDTCGISLPPVAPVAPRGWEHLVECPYCAARFNAPETKAVVYCRACGQKMDNWPHEQNEFLVPGG